MLLPVEPDGFQCEIRARRPARLLVEGKPGGTALTALDAVLARLRHAADPADRGLYAAFVVECRRTLDAMRLHARVRPGVVERLTVTYGGEPTEQWAGVRARSRTTPWPPSAITPSTPPAAPASP